MPCSTYGGWIQHDTTGMVYILVMKRRALAYWIIHEAFVSTQ
jgi:hypothetical protein